jgi:DUF4097 and DUF4098 domain-containing protein YvlB
MNGTIVVRGEDRRDLLVTSNTTGNRRRDREPPPSAAGLRQLVGPSGLSVTEERNQVTITGGGRSFSGRMAEVEIRVPTRTDVRLDSINGRDIVVENVDGEIEATHMNGGIRLVNVSGSVLAHSHNGSVVATLLRAAPDRAMAFTTFNGHVDVTLPGDTKALLKVRSDAGEVFTAFDTDLQPAVPSSTRQSDRRTRVNGSRTILAAINGGGPEIELRTFNGNIYVRRR